MKIFEFSANWRGKKAIISNVILFIIISVIGFYICDYFELGNFSYFALGVISMFFDVENISITKD